MMSDLHRRGFEALDLGRADLNPGLTRFKRGSGADIETLAGSFLFHPWFMKQKRRVAHSCSMVNSSIQH